MSGNLLKEKYLLFRAKNKDPHAFAELYDLYAERLYRFIYFKVSSTEEAQDLTSEVFLKTWQYILDGKEIENLNALFYKIARNLVIDFYRKNLHKKETSLDETIATDTALEELRTDSVITDLERTMDLDAITQQIRGLKDEYREVLVLRYIDDLSVSEIADVLGKKAGNVRVIIYRALQSLKDMVDGVEQAAAVPEESNEQESAG